jgi:acetyl esterase/lipase
MHERGLEKNEEEAVALDEIEPFPGLGLTDELRAAVLRDEQHIPGPDGAPDVRVLTYRPREGTAGTLPLIVNMHGGAFALRADMFPAIDARLALLDAFVVSVDYRIVPDHPFPCGVEDCYAALSWATQHVEVDPDRVVVTGASAGGALAAAVAMMARDRGGPRLVLQALTIPVLDDRCDTPSMRQYVEAPLFGAPQAVDMWDRYLGADRSSSNVSPYAAPGRAVDLAGLPPAFIQVNGLDPLRDEGIAYAMRLMEAGVPVELYCAPNQHHGVSDDPRTQLQAARLYHEAIQAMIR